MDLSHGDGHGRQSIASRERITGGVHVVGLVRVALEKAFGRAYHVREEKPIALDDQSEPDVVVVPGRPRDYLDAHPARPVLVVEVAATSLVIDRVRKGSLYARAGIADYWVAGTAAI